MKSIAIIILIFIMSVLLMPAKAFSQVNAYVSLDRDTVYVSDTFELKITVSGSINTTSPEIVDMDDFTSLGQSVSQNIQIINGQMSANKTYRYRFIANKQGTFQVGKAYLKSSNQTIQINPVTLRVLDQPQVTQKFSQSQASPPNQPFSPENVGDKNFYMEAEIINNEPYLNEQTIYKVKLFLRKDITNPNFQKPEFKDFIVEDLEEKQQKYVLINNNFYSVIEYSYALFPTKTGKITIKPTKLSGQMVVSSDPFDYLTGVYDTIPVNIESNPVEINVKPLPVKPSNYNNLIGDYYITTQIDQTELETGENATLKIIISGIGNTKNFNLKGLNIDDSFRKSFKIYEATPKNTITSRKDYISSQKIFKYDLVALKPGTFIIDPTDIVAFNTEKNRYETLLTEKIMLNVKLGKNTENLSVEIPDTENLKQPSLEEIIDIHTSENILKNSTIDSMKYLIYFVGFVMPLLILGIVYFYLKRENKIHENTPEIKRKNAFKIAKNQIKSIKNLLNESKSHDIYYHLEKIIKEFVGNKTKMQTGSWTANDISNHLKKLNIDDETITNVTKILKDSEHSQYSTSQIDNSALLDIYQETLKLLKKLDKELK